MRTYLCHCCTTSYPWQPNVFHHALVADLFSDGTIREVSVVQRGRIRKLRAPRPPLFEGITKWGDLLADIERQGVSNSWQCPYAIAKAWGLETVPERRIA